MPRACHTCAVAKVKCVAGLGNDKTKCERCLRLGLECLKQAAVVRKHRQQKTARLAQLEERVDSIVSLLISPPQSVREKEQPYPSSGVSQLDSSVPTPSNDRLDGLSMERPHESTNSNDHDSRVVSYMQEDATGDLQAAAIGPGRLPCESTQYSSEIISAFDPSPEEADILLHVFQTQMAEHFPFVVIPAGTTAQCLRREKPFLYQMIILSASGRNLWDPKACRRLVTEYLGLHVLVREEKSLDLLQGLLVYISWGNYQFYIEGQMTSLLQLAVALMTDLGLNRPPDRASPKQRSMIDDAKAALGIIAKSQTQGFDEYRAFAGCFYLTSTSNSLSKRSGTLPFNSYLEKCCVELSRGTEYRTDIYLVQMVRLQHFVERISQSLISDEIHPSWNMKAPIAFYIRSMESELGKWKSSLPSDLDQHTQLMVLYHSVGMRLHEIGLHMPRVITDGAQIFQRAEILNTCLSSTISFFESYFRIPTELYSRLTFAPWLHMGYAITTACRLLLHDVNGWDVHHARKLLDFSDVLRQICERFEQAGNIDLVNRREFPNGDNAFLQYSKRLGWVRTWYESKLIAESNPTMSKPQDMSFSAFEGDSSLMDFMGIDDAFWQEFMGDWDFTASQKDAQACGDGLQPAV
ncbi:hypothetical protein MMC17_006739 [Xylographa soralifera]|nr:hypothetical protein [Xylographa soralifera]